jgi:hypothetical protein
MTTTPRKPTLDEIIAFLLGEGELNGRWFGEGPPPAYRGILWWRTELRAAWNRRAAPARKQPAHASRVDDRRLGELINFAQDELNCAEDWNQEQRANIVAALQRLRTLEADARRLKEAVDEACDYLSTLVPATNSDDMASALTSVVVDLRSAISAEAAPKCKTCDEGMVRCTKPGCPCGGDGCDPCPDCSKGGQK